MSDVYKIINEKKYKHYGWAKTKDVTNEFITALRKRFSVKVFKGTREGYDIYVRNPNSKK